MCAFHCCPFFASSRPSLCVHSKKHFHSCRVKFQWIFDVTLTAYSELKPFRTSLPTQTLIPWLFGHNYRTKTVGAYLVAQLVKKSACNLGGLGLISGLGKIPREGKGYPLQFSGLGNSMNCIVHGVTKSWTPLGNFHFHRTVDAFAFNCYPIRWKALDVWSFIPHTIALTVSCPKIMW